MSKQRSSPVSASSPEAESPKDRVSANPESSPDNSLVLELARDASRAKAEEPLPYLSQIEAGLGLDLGDVRVQTGRTDLVGAGAAAATLGRDEVLFAEKEPSLELAAHEAVHLAQLRGSDEAASTGPLSGGAGLEQEADALGAKVAAGQKASPAATTATTAPLLKEVSDVPGLANLTDPSLTGTGTGEEDAARNSNDPATRLPFSADGRSWDHTAILNKLGQYDQLAGTDSDSSRCVQAVALASHILRGPSATISFLGTQAMRRLYQGATTGPDGQPVLQPVTERMKAAMGVITTVQGRIADATANFGDMAWAQEALHDMFYADHAGTTADQVVGQIAPDGGFDRGATAMADWHETARSLGAQGATLKEGEQLIVVSYDVYFNTKPGSGLPNVNTRGARPRAGQIDDRRDAVTGHQLLLFKQDGVLALYEPSLTDPGTHLSTVDASGKGLETLFKDQPSFDLFRYANVVGKIASPTA